MVGSLRAVTEAGVDGGADGGGDPGGALSAGRLAGDLEGGLDVAVGEDTGGDVAGQVPGSPVQGCVALADRGVEDTLDLTGEGGVYRSRFADFPVRYMQL